MTGPRKLLLILMGVVSAFLMVAQLALGQLILSGATGTREKLIKAHQHTGYSAIALALAYVLISLWTIINAPTKPKA
ncbi:MAG TPA: hypothetical protein VFT74_15295 [Isosphaeraceae bacterium]|nr:hypothetical protein [Isosphaeraceae bacterium]